MENPKPTTLTKATKGCSVFLLFFCLPWALAGLVVLGGSVLLGLDPMILEIEWIAVRILIVFALLGAFLLFLGTREFKVPHPAKANPMSPQVNTTKQNVMKI